MKLLLQFISIIHIRRNIVSNDNFRLTFVHFRYYLISSFEVMTSKYVNVEARMKEYRNSIIINAINRIVRS